MSLVIVKLFNKVLQNGKFPKVWNLSCISSIFKSGNPNDCNNYRGICVSSCLSKLFTSLLQNRLTNFLEKQNLFFNVIDKLLLEKIKNMIFNNILGVHSKASNLAIQTELGYYPICIKSYKLVFKYYSRLVDIESNCDSKFNLLRAAFIEDKNLYNNKHPSWVHTVFQLEKMLNVESYFDFKQLIETLY
jgi:hypothetical protein